jgi:hypothetical protein
LVSSTLAMKNKLISAIVTVLVFIFLSLINPKISDLLLSLVIILLSFLTIFLTLSLIKDTINKQLKPATQTVRQLVLMLIFSICLSGAMAYFSYYLIENSAFEIMCKISPCQIGPYGWSVALLSISISCLFFIMTGLFVRRLVNKCHY